MRCESFRIGHPIRGSNVPVHAQQGVSAVAAPRHACAIQNAAHDIAAILSKVSEAVALPRKLKSMRRFTCLEQAEGCPVTFVRHAITRLAYGGNLRMSSAPARIVLGEHFPWCARCERRVACWLARFFRQCDSWIRGIFQHLGFPARVGWASSISYHG
jgi:hypothetical protein